MSRTGKSVTVATESSFTLWCCKKISVWHDTSVCELIVFMLSLFGGIPVHATSILFWKTDMEAKDAWLSRYCFHKAEMILFCSRKGRNCQIIIILQSLPRISSCITKNCFHNSFSNFLWFMLSFPLSFMSRWMVETVGMHLLFYP